MRIATSTLYDTNATNIDNLTSTYQTQGTQLSTGKSLNAPSDDPTVIAQDLTVRADSAVQTQLGKNFTDLGNQLTTVDGALGSLTSILQNARSLAIEGASDQVSTSQRGDIATQIDQLLQEAIGLANTQYNGKYVFSGTEVPQTIPLAIAQGSPATAVLSQGNTVQQTQQLPNGNSVVTGVTLQQAFNVNATDGSNDVFQTLINLRDTLKKGVVVDESQHSLNLAGTSITAATTIAQLTQGASPQIADTPLTPDSTGQVTINIAGGLNTSGANVTFLSTDTIATVLAKINAQTATTGVAASFNYQTQRLVLKSTANPNAPFEVQDIPSTGATNTGNFIAAFNLFSQATVTSNVSTQIGDLDKTIQQALNARAVVGSTIQAVQALGNTSSSQVLNDTTVQSALEDTDIAKVTSDFSRTQTVLQAAYATTTRLESKTLFDYLQ